MVQTGNVAGCDGAWLQTERWKDVQPKQKAIISTEAGFFFSSAPGSRWMAEKPRVNSRSASWRRSTESSPPSHLGQHLESALARRLGGPGWETAEG